MYLFRPVKADTTLENSLAFFYFILKFLDSSLFSLRGQLHNFIFHLFILFFKPPPLIPEKSKGNEQMMRSQRHCTINLQQKPNLSCSSNALSSDIFCWVCSYSFSEDPTEERSHLSSLSVFDTSSAILSRLIVRCLFSAEVFIACATQVFICKNHRSKPLLKFTHFRV